MKSRKWLVNVCNYYKAGKYWHVQLKHALLIWIFDRFVVQMFWIPTGCRTSVYLNHYRCLKHLTFTCVLTFSLWPFIGICELVQKMSLFPKLCIIIHIINKPDHTSWARVIPVFSYFICYPVGFDVKRQMQDVELLFLQIQQGKKQGWWEAEGEVMSSPAFLQLFSRYINMKQGADLRIDGRGGAENGGKDTKGDLRESTGFDLIDDQCCRNDWLLLRWLNSKGL